MYIRIVTLLIIITNFFSLSVYCAKTKYFIPSIRANWFKANEFCNSLHMRLLIVKSKDENDAVGRYVKTTEKFTEEGCSFWMGATDLAEEGTFIWTATGEPLTYNNWRRGEPNDGMNENEDCLQLVYMPKSDYIWHWNDNICTEKILYFICEQVDNDCVTNF
ncbi:low affinity immunoglobulin epsilon Fc receptor-like [Malaya genurostris]|uniref:low affinity immunoglobulin epsilon Fc receptor-like n=1 Tax=Malaya genurostris TaxID=325434 RepID=UPI0026F3F19D|nr:low affinity immunoglobulin epsilon Fc receptor-like [Malaya genurostris]